MKYPRTGNLLIPSILLVFFVILAKSGFFNYPVQADTSGVMMDKVFYYFINILVWATASYLLNLFLNIFFWSGMLKVKTGNRLGQRLHDFSSVFIYTIAFAIILFAVFGVEYNSAWLLVLLVILVLGTFIRQKLVSLISTKYLSTENPFNIGDWIELLNVDGSRVLVGEVTDISRKGTRIKTEDNGIVLVPNNLMENQYLIKNYWGLEKQTRFEVKFCIDFSVPVQRAKRVLFAGAKRAIKEQGILEAPEPQVLALRTTGNGIEYVVKYWIIPWDNLSPDEANDKVISVILDHLVKSGLSLSYQKNDIFISKMPSRQTDINNLKDRIKLLSNINLFSSFNVDEITTLATKMSLEIFKKDETIIEQGKSGDSMFILIEGLLDVFVGSQEKSPVYVGQLVPGQFFGEFSLLTGEQRSATVISSTDAMVFEINKESIAPILLSRSEVIDEMSGIIAVRQKINVDKLAESHPHKKQFSEILVGKIKKFFGLAK